MIMGCSNGEYAMQVSDKVPPVQNTPYIKGAAKTESKGTATPSAKAERVELSVRARQFQAARQAIEKMDDVDHEKVARIKAQIQAGTYKVDAEKIAAKMLEESL